MMTIIILVRMMKREMTDMATLKLVSLCDVSIGISSSS